MCEPPRHELRQPIHLQHGHKEIGFVARGGAWSARQSARQPARQSAKQPATPGAPVQGNEFLFKGWTRPPMRLGGQPGSRTDIRAAGRPARQPGN
eukprot:366326-Chlamydomonas_euryale.AAC.2